MSLVSLRLLVSGSWYLFSFIKMAEPSSDVEMGDEQTEAAIQTELDDLIESQIEDDEQEDDQFTEEIVDESKTYSRSLSLLVSYNVV